MAENSAATAIAATENLLAKVDPHIDDSMGLMALGDFLPVALESLKTIGRFEVEALVVLQQYIATCDKLTEAIQTRDSRGQQNLNAVTVEDKSWIAHLKTLQLHIQTLQVQAITKKLTTPLPKYDEPPPYTK
jgi:hypothetical protein